MDSAHDSELIHLLEDAKKLSKIKLPLPYLCNSKTFGFRFGVKILMQCMYKT